MDSLLELAEFLPDRFNLDQLTRYNFAGLAPVLVHFGVGLFQVRQDVTDLPTPAKAVKSDTTLQNKVEKDLSEALSWLIQFV